MTEYRYIEPLDVLYLRGNRLFGGPGEHGEALMPPWPSMVAGALRSRMLVDAGVADFMAYRKGDVDLGALAPVLGLPDAPGDFRITWFSLARRATDGAVEPIVPLPADLVAVKKNAAEDNREIELLRMQPQSLPSEVLTGALFPQVPVLRASEPAKPERGWWLSRKALTAYLRGECPSPTHLLPRETIWHTDPRLGIALDTATRTAAEGQIYTVDAVAMIRDDQYGTGFLVAVEGAGERLPEEGLLRFGGDGRGARIAVCGYHLPQPDWTAMETTGTFKLILTTPGIFPQGWKLPGIDEQGLWQGPEGCTARLVAASVPRYEVVSGWDLARPGPKPALRVAPMGSVYWLEDLRGSAADLHKLAEEGFWALEGFEYPDLQRRAEGFSGVMVANWLR